MLNTYQMDNTGFKNFIDGHLTGVWYLVSGCALLGFLAVTPVATLLVIKEIFETAFKVYEPDLALGANWIFWAAVGITSCGVWVWGCFHKLKASSNRLRAMGFLLVSISILGLCFYFVFLLEMSIGGLRFV